MIIYKCDKCGKTFDWYESFYYNKKFNNMGHKEMQQWKKENPDANYGLLKRWKDIVHLSSMQIGMI